MKQLFLFLLLPLYSLGQTIHFEEDKILYKGNVKLAHPSTAAILSQLQEAAFIAADKSKAEVNLQADGSRLDGTGTIRLKTPHSIIRTLHFRLQLTPNESGYDYQVDSVLVKERRRGWKETTTPAAELLETMEETGNVAIKNEMLLNEIDLRIQKLLTILENRMKNPQPLNSRMEPPTVRDGPSTQ